jgi:hypothetical protein
MLADSEEGDDLGRDFDCNAGSRVPSAMRLAMLDEEDAKASDLDAVSPGKCSPNRREDRFDNPLDIAISQMRVQLCDLSD